MGDISEIQIRHARDRGRYEAIIDGAVAGYAEYAEYVDLVVFFHTVTEEAFGGRGVGSAVVNAALDDVREQGSHRVVPVCSFVRGWIRKHPDYAALLYGATTATP